MSSKNLFLWRIGSISTYSEAGYWSVSIYLTWPRVMLTFSITKPGDEA